jgi:hypothetical protein
MSAYIFYNTCETYIIRFIIGISNIVTVGVRNKAGLEHMAVSKSVIQDNTAPDSGTVECQKFIQVREYIIVVIKKKDSPFLFQ